MMMLMVMMAMTQRRVAPPLQEPEGVHTLPPWLPLQLHDVVVVVGVAEGCPWLQLPEQRHPGGQP